MNLRAQASRPASRSAKVFGNPKVSLWLIAHHGIGTSWHRVNGSTVMRRPWLVEQAAKTRFTPPNHRV